MEYGMVLLAAAAAVAIMVLVGWIVALAEWIWVRRALRRRRCQRHPAAAGCRVRAA